MVVGLLFSHLAAELYGGYLARFGIGGDLCLSILFFCAIAFYGERAAGAESRRNFRQKSDAGR